MRNKQEEVSNDLFDPQVIKKLLLLIAAVAVLIISIKYVFF